MLRNKPEAGTRAGRKRPDCPRPGKQLSEGGEESGSGGARGVSRDRACWSTQADTELATMSITPHRDAKFSESPILLERPSVFIVVERLDLCLAWDSG